MNPQDPIWNFLKFAEENPDHPAVEQNAKVVTYGQLENLARKFATAFKAIHQPRILIALPQGPDAYAAMIGSILSGGYYIPVNVRSPENKIARIIKLAKPDIIVCDAETANLMSRNASEALIIETRALENIVPLEGTGSRNSVAYLIFTSGSTGFPKGVVIPTSALSHYVNWLNTERVFRPDDRVSQFPSIGFDLSVLDIYGALNSGATLITPHTTGDRLFPAEFARRTRVSVWVSVPSAISLVMQGGQATSEYLRGVRQFLFCGEALRRPQLDAIFKAQPSADVINLYGPTEATVSMTSLRLSASSYEHLCENSAALGDPIPGMALHLLEGESADKGEIVIAGPQLADGYWQDEATTKRAFRTVEVGGIPVRGYFTGDLGERVGGRIFFRGRMDHQIKINGYRLETGEIVARLAEAGWAVACVLTNGDYLVAVVESVPGQTFDAAELRSRLRKELDPYAVPKKILCIERMPRNDNEKLDESAVRVWLQSLDGRDLFFQPPP